MKKRGSRPKQTFIRHRRKRTTTFKEQEGDDDHDDNENADEEEERGGSNAVSEETGEPKEEMKEDFGDIKELLVLSGDSMDKSDY